MEAFIEEKGERVHIQMVPKKFKTGNVGFSGGGRFTLGGRVFQITVNAVDLTAKTPRPAPSPKTEEEGLQFPKYILLPTRLVNDLKIMMNYSIKTDQETGGFLVKALHGNLGVIGEQLGEDREVVIKPNEELHKGEKLYGSVHSHPKTKWASTGDVIGFLRDPFEKVMIVTGADNSINVYLKTPLTQEGDFEEFIEENCSQDDMDAMANIFGFVWYRGKDNKLELQNTELSDKKIDLVDDEWKVEDLIDALGLEGVEDFPENYFTKKYPIKKEFAVYCK